MARPRRGARMPEGDTVHKLARFMAPRLEGHTVVSVQLNGRPLDGVPLRVDSVRSAGKYLLVTFDDGCCLRTHLGMHGSWHRYDRGEVRRSVRGRVSVELKTAREEYVCFNAKEVALSPRQDGQGRFAVRDVEFDLLGPDLDFAEVVRRARVLLPGATPLVDVLLAQRVASGIGNVYKSELLFLERLAPAQTLARTNDAALMSLYRRGRALLQANLGSGPRTTRREQGSRLWVYRRAGEPCLSCEGTVAVVRWGRHLRSTYWCPACQGTQDTLPWPLATEGAGGEIQ